ncbi:SDR family NAD(P)-dependent oxidoreductase [Saccharomonospora piscinae]|uniref:SDR family NAD(P)-dependent oxidoreductase n=1 Tax=Saccharomonospora piscinae TaxID=687388 RepID=UPI0004672856|nr:SDR family NAD(P)-dependent oxidoreductase [Saccharomonospora piscinae]
MKTVFLTGCTSGLGLALATRFTARGDRVLLHGRDESRLGLVAATLRAAGGRVTEVVADITEPDSVAALCESVGELADSLDLVVNNAAVGGGRDPGRREVNARGTELRMAGNYLAPYQISRRLASLLARDGRIVNVASVGQAPLDLDDLDFTRAYEGVTAYCRSKLALIMDTIELSAQGVHVNAVHPAHLMPTTMVRDSGFVPQATMEDGVLPVLRVALDTALSTVTGRYFDRFDLAEPHRQAHDPAVRRALANWAESRVGW